MSRKNSGLKILHVLNGFGFGGTETWLLEVVRFNHGMHQMDFLLTGGSKRELDEEFSQFGCKLHYVRYSARNAFAFVNKFRQIMEHEAYDVVHDHEDFVAGWHWLFLLGKLPRVRISHAHNSLIYVKNYLKTGAGRKVFYKGGRLLASRLSTKITGTSEKLMEELGYHARLYKNKKIEPLYCGCCPEQFLFNQFKRSQIRSCFGFNENDRVVIFVGRIGLSSSIYQNHKNPEFAFELAVSIAQQHRNFKFLFVGHKGEFGHELEIKSREKGLSESIIFLGTRTDVSSLLSAADVMLFTSVVEPFGLTLVEAQFSGLPIVASDIITKEIIEFPELFRLLDLKDDKLTWEKCLIESAQPNFNRQGFCKANRSQIMQSKFSIGNSFRRMIQHYSES